MKLLFTANRFPYPPFRGDKLKIFNLAKQLSPKHELHLLTFLQDEQDRSYLSALEPFFKKIHLVPLSKSHSLWEVVKDVFSRLPLQVSYFHAKEMERLVAKLHQEEHYDAVHIQHLRMAPYWAPYTDIPRILDLPDAYSLYWLRRKKAAKGLKKWLNLIEYQRILGYEKVLRQFDKVLVCSKEDLKYLEDTHQLKNLALLPNGVDTTLFSSQTHDYTHRQIILFTGNMDYAPNVDGVVYFAEQLLPEIRKTHPQVRFIIAGQRPVARVRRLANKHIEVTGFVKDLKVLYEQAAIVIAPLRFGAGTQNKVLEAMAMGVPVVTGKVGFAGLNTSSGNGILLAENKEEFIKACNQLLANQSLREQIGRKAKAIIQSQFSWESVSAQLEHYFESIVKE